jgi:hypothetical protein
LLPCLNDTFPAHYRLVVARLTHFLSPWFFINLKPG